MQMVTETDERRSHGTIYVGRLQNEELDHPIARSTDFSSQIPRCQYPKTKQVWPRTNYFKKKLNILKLPCSPRRFKYHEHGLKVGYRCYHWWQSSLHFYYGVPRLNVARGRASIHANSAHPLSSTYPCACLLGTRWIGRLCSTASIHTVVACEMGEPSHPTCLKETELVHGHCWEDRSSSRETGPGS